MASWKAQSLLTSIITLLLVVIVADESFKKKCLKDATVPEYPVNVYYCYEESKAECCIEDTQYTCCEPTDSVTMIMAMSIHSWGDSGVILAATVTAAMLRYQAIIWGSIGGAIVLALIVFLYLKSDNYDCEGPILYKYVLCWRRGDADAVKSARQRSVDMTFDDAASAAAAAEACDAIDASSRPVSQTSLVVGHA